MTHTPNPFRSGLRLGALLAAPLIVGALIIMILGCSPAPEDELPADVLDDVRLERVTYSDGTSYIMLISPAIGDTCYQAFLPSELESARAFYDLATRTGSLAPAVISREDLRPPQ